VGLISTSKYNGLENYLSIFFLRAPLRPLWLKVLVLVLVLVFNSGDFGTSGNFGNLF